MEIRPRRFMRRVLDRDPRRWVLFLAVLSGPALILDAGEEPGGRIGLLLVVLIGPVLGLLNLFTDGWLVYLGGQTLGGKASRHELHAAYAWATIPLITVAPFEIPRLLCSKPAGLTEWERWIYEVGRALGGFPSLLSGTAGLLAAYLAVVFVAEAQRFSLLRAVANHLVAGLIVFGVVAVAVTVYSLSH